MYIYFGYPDSQLIKLWAQINDSLSLSPVARDGHWYFYRVGLWMQQRKNTPNPTITTVASAASCEMIAAVQAT